jgi:hypothetical protein
MRVLLLQEKGHVTADCKLRIELLSKMTRNQNSWADQGDQSKGGRGQTQGNLAIAGTHYQNGRN